MAILTGSGPDMQGIFRDGEALNVPGWGDVKTRSFQIRQDMMGDLWCSGAALSGTECSPLAAGQGAQAQTDAQTFPVPTALVKQPRHGQFSLTPPERLLIIRSA